MSWSDKLNSGIERLYSSPDVELRALGVNLKYDERIPQTRKNAIHAMARQSPLTDKECFELFGEYHWAHVKNTTQPHFRSSYDDSNLAHDFSQPPAYGERSSLNRNVPLGRVVDLTHYQVFKSLETAARWLDAQSDNPLKEYEPLQPPQAAAQRDLLTTIPTSQDGDGQTDPYDKYQRWLKDRLIDSEDGHANARLLVYTLLQMSQPEERRFDCMWCTPTAVDSPSDQCALEWSELSGVMPRKGQILVLLSYPAFTVKTLHQPCQLDAGCYPLHFPTPPSHSRVDGGCAVDVTCTRENPQKEFIHENLMIPFESLQVVDVKKVDRNYPNLADPTESKDSCVLERIRQHHYRQLLRNYGDLSEWMEETEVMPDS